jgi:hypothetical protein
MSGPVLHDVTPTDQIPALRRRPGAWRNASVAAGGALAARDTVIALDRHSLVRLMGEQQMLDGTPPEWFDVDLVVDAETRAEIDRMREEYAAVLAVVREARARLAAMAPAYDALVRRQYEQICDALEEYPTVPPTGLARALFDWTNARSGVRDLVAMEAEIQRGERSARNPR